MLFFLYIGCLAEEWFGKGDSIALEVNKLTDCGTLSTLNFETHHDEGDNVELSESKEKVLNVAVPNTLITPLSMTKSEL